MSQHQITADRQRENPCYTAQCRCHHTRCTHYELHSLYVCSYVRLCCPLRVRTRDQFLLLKLIRGIQNASSSRPTYSSALYCTSIPGTYSQEGRGCEHPTALYCRCTSDPGAIKWIIRSAYAKLPRSVELPLGEQVAGAAANRNHSMAVQHVRPCPSCGSAASIDLSGFMPNGSSSGFCSSKAMAMFTAIASLPSALRHGTALKRID